MQQAYVVVKSYTTIGLVSKVNSLLVLGMEVAGSMSIDHCERDRPKFIQTMVLTEERHQVLKSYTGRYQDLVYRAQNLIDTLPTSVMDNKLHVGLERLIGFEVDENLVTSDNEHYIINRESSDANDLATLLIILGQLS